MPSGEAISYRQKISYCGKPYCRKCRDGVGHGPYWYRYQTISGRTVCTYVGKELPPDARAAMESAQTLLPPFSHDLERASIRVYTLGRFRLERRTGRDPAIWQPVTDPLWQQPQTRALLARLICAPGRKIRRQRVMRDLWPQEESSYLGLVVRCLRRLLGRGKKGMLREVLLSEEESYLVLADQSHIWVDADAFERLVASAFAQTDPALQERLFEEAASLYGSDFLSEEHAAWARTRRLTLRRDFERLLLALSDLALARGDASRVLDALNHLLILDPANEAAVQRVLVVLAGLKRRGEALRIYRRFIELLSRDKLGVPSEETSALYEALQQGELLPSLTRLSDRVRSQLPTFGAPLQVGRSHSYPLIGRERELEALCGLIVAAEQAAAHEGEPELLFDTRGFPQCAFLVGEVGIGKTRLLEEVSQAAHERGWAVVWGAAYAHEGSSPYRLWSEVLRKAMARGAWQREALFRRPLVFQPLLALLPELASLLPQTAAPSRLEPAQEQLRLWEAARELLVLISSGTPLLIALDDLQWADHSSCELLAYLAHRVHGQSIVIVGSLREHELPQSHPLRRLLTDLQREHAVESIALRPLSSEQIDTLVSHMSSLSGRIIERICEHAAGNPYFAEELVHSIVDAQEDLRLPETISAVLDLRLSRISLACQRLLAEAAVLGGSFEFWIINEMEAASNEDVVLELLEEGLRSGMLTEEGVGVRITYHFWHPLLVSHLYERLSAARRANLHRRAAEILRRANPRHEEELAATITYHLVAGGAEDARIVRYAEMAGDYAYGLSSYPDAERHYRITLAHLPDTLEVQLHRAELLERLGECTRVQGKFEEARHCFEQALEAHNRPGIAITDSQQEAQIQALLWCKIGWTWYDAGDNAKARQYYEQGEQFLRDSRILAGPVWATIRLRRSYLPWREGDYTEARRMALEALRLFEETRNEHNAEDLSPLAQNRLASDPVDLGRIHVLLAIVANSSGQNKEALIHLNTALSLYEQNECLREIAIVCCDLGDTHMRRAEYAKAQAFLRRSLNVAERIGDLPILSFSLGNLGLLESRRGNLAEAEEEFKRSLALAERINDPMGLSTWYSRMGSVLVEEGKLSDARGALCHACAYARAQHNTPSLGMALVALGHLHVAQTLAVHPMSEKQAQHDEQRMLLCARRALHRAVALSGIEEETRIEGLLALAEAMRLAGTLDEARNHTEQALREAERCEVTWLVARALRTQGVILATQRKTEQAEHYFAQALQTAEQYGMRLEFARTLLQHGLVRLSFIKERQRQEGLEFLRKALHIFNDCHAALDAQIAEHAISHYDERRGEQLSSP